MKVILLQDVAKIGKKFTIVDVPDGYALNQLVPKKLAEPATPVNLKRVEKMKSDNKASADTTMRQYEANAAALAGVKVTIETEVNEQGHLFKAISTEEIAGAAKAVGISIDTKQIVISKPIKESGEHTVVLSHGGKNNPFAVVVVKRK